MTWACTGNLYVSRHRLRVGQAIAVHPKIQYYFMTNHVLLFTRKRFTIGLRVGGETHKYHVTSAYHRQCITHTLCALPLVSFPSWFLLSLSFVPFFVCRSLGIFKRLLEQGSIAKILPYYNLRHTFITHQIYDLGRHEKIVNAWCEHSEDISRKHYQDTATLAMAINPEMPATNQAQQASELDLLKEQLRKQQELIDQLLKSK
ncbi:hypothetical protein [Nostoc sp.]|uniref:hypothetical protein n=1 Tax=Nostoc sp. TaxID=1180 RepID=UPI002FF6FF69